MRPLLNPGLRRIWRDPATVQFGVDIPSPVVLYGVDDLAAGWLAALDGSTDLEQLLVRVRDEGQPVAEFAALVEDLVASGAVIDAGSWPGGIVLTAAARQRLEPDFAAAALSPTSTLGPAARYERLAATRVAIHGTSRLGAALGTLLSAAGVGELSAIDDQVVRAGDVGVAAFEPSDVGNPRAAIAHHWEHWAGVDRHANLRQQLQSQTSGSDPQLSILTDAIEVRAVAQQLSAAGSAHLVVSCAERLGRIGPLVLPGQSPCMRCHDLTRTDHDAGWPRVVLQLGDGARPVARDATLTLATAATAVLHVIDWLCSGHPPSMDGVVEHSLPHGTSSFHPFPVHPSCGCTWPTARAQDTMTG